MIQAVFFDFGGVVATVDHEHMRRLEGEFGLPERALWRSMYETPEWRELRVGQGSEEAWVLAIRRSLDEAAGRPVADQVSERWVECWRGLDEGIMGLMEALRGRYRVGMISNATLTLEDELRDHHGIDGVFEVIVNSARIGVAKPDPRIYHHAANALNVQPGACVHIDDLPHNIEGARQAGFGAVHYDGDLAALKVRLRELGVEC